MLIIKYAECGEDKISQREVAKSLRNDLLESLFSIKISDEDIRVSKHGKPFLRGYDIDFSVTHSAGICAFAVCFVGDKISNVILSDKNTIVVFEDYSRVGVDIELVKKENKYDNYKKIASKYFSAGEIDEINKLSAEAYVKEFTKIWTIKESICKMEGIGLNYLKKADSIEYKKNCRIDSIVINVGTKTYFLSFCAQ